MTRYYNIFFSPTGGTKKVADIIINELIDNKSDKELLVNDIDLCFEQKPIILEHDDICLISVPSYGGRVPEVCISRLKKFKGNGTKAILNCVYGNRHWDDTLSELQDCLKECGFTCIAGIAAVAEHSIFREYGKGRPDESDKKDLISFTQKIKEKLNSSEIDEPNLPGKHGIGNYKEYKTSSSFKPKADENCVACGLCVNQCPAKAIPFDKPRLTNDNCIGCMRCVSFCPIKCRSFDKEMLKKLSERLAPALASRKDNHLFI
jgi:ferredoxin